MTRTPKRKTETRGAAARAGATALALVLDAQAPEPLYRQIAAQVVARIRAGALAAGARLPPARALALALGVNPVTAVTAYRHLARQGWVTSRVGSGTVVCQRLDDTRAGSGQDAAPPGAAHFPTDVLRRIINHILDTEGAAAFGYDDPGGYAPLQQSIRHYLRQAGIDPAGHEVVIFSGAQQGLSVIVQALVQRGDWVLVERPTYPGILRLLQRAGAQTAAVDLASDGPDLNAVRRLFRTRPIRLAYLMPVYQNPTGFCYSMAKKRVLATLCAEHGVTLAEDDSLSDLDYGAGRFKPLRAGAGPGDMLYLKSFSRLLMPGFRLGFCLAPPAVAAMLRKAKEETDLFTSGFFQRVLHLFLHHGYFAEHRARLEQEERGHFLRSVHAARQILVPAGFRLAPPAGGPRLWVHVPAGADPGRVRAACARRGLAVTAGAEFATDGATAGCLSLVFGGVPEAAWTSLLQGVVAAVTPRRGTGTGES